MLQSRLDSLAITHHQANGLLLRGTTRVVLVHGAMDRSRSFGRVIRHLTATGFDCVSYDRRGYEASALQKPFSLESPPAIDEHIEDLAGVIGDEPAIVFGHSLGGTIALLLAAQNRSPISAVVTFESPLPWMSFWNGGGAYSIQPGTPISNEFAEDFAAQFMIRMLGQHRWDRLPPSTKARRKAEGTVLVAEMSTVAHLSPPPELNQILSPSLICASANAPERHVQAVEYLATTIPRVGKVMVTDTDHGIHLSDPAKASELVELAHSKYTC